MLETVIVLPALLLIWAGVTHTARTFDRGQDVGADTRKHAWEHALAGCTGVIPPGTTASDATLPAGFDALWSSALRLPFVHLDWPELWPSEGAYERMDGVAKPALLDAEGRANELRHRTTVMCNETSVGAPIDTYTGQAWGRWGFGAGGGG